MPCRQCGQVPSLKANGQMTQSPCLTFAHVGADVFDDADELVADRAGLERRVAAVVPEVRAADAGEDDADDRVGGLDDRRIAPVAGGDGAGLVEDGCTHDLQLSARSATVGGPVRGVLTGHPCPAAARGTVEFVDPANDIAEFLTSRRAKVTPEQVGLPTLRPAPRARGCAARRSPRWPASASSTTSGWSAATPAASPTACSRRSPARCGSTTPSAPTSSISRAPPTPSRPSAAAPRPAARPAGRAAHRRRDHHAGDRAQQPRRLPRRNALGRALYAPVFESREQPANSARFTFLDPAAQDFYADWERTAQGPRRAPALRGRPQPLRPRALGPGRRAVDAQRRSSAPGGRRTTSATTRPASSGCTTRSSASSSSQLRGHGALRRRRPDRQRLQRRARQPLRSRRSTCWPAGRATPASERREPTARRPRGAPTTPNREEPRR